MTPLVSRALDIVLGFVRERTPESSTRLCAVLCCATGCANTLGTLVFAFVNHGQATTVAALMGGTGALIGSGCVALSTRSRKLSTSSAPSSGLPGGGP